MIKRRIAILFILLGTGLVLYGVGSHIYYKKEENELIDLIEESFENDEIENSIQNEENLDNNTNQNDNNEIKNSESNNNQDKSNASTKEKSKSNSEKEDNFVNEKVNPIGILEIPSIKLKAGIIKGATTTELRKGIGYYTNTALPSENEGNFVIAAHDSGKMPIFRNLKSLNIGDEIIVRQKNESFKYVVTDKFIVDPYDVEILQNREGEKIITMFTCTNKGKQRLVVRGLAI